MNRPLILHLLDKFYPPDPRVDGEMTALRNAGFRTKLAVFQSAPFKREDVINLPMSKQIFRFSALAYTVPVYIIYLKYHLRKVIKKERPAFLHVHDITMAEAVRQLSAEFGIPYILDLHENRPEIMQHYPFMQRILSRMLISIDRWRMAEKRLMQDARHCIVVTEEARTWYTKHFRVRKEKISVTPNAVDLEFLVKADKSRLTDVQNGLQMIYIGETSSRRGTESLIKAMSDLKSQNINAHCTILGRSRDDSRWVELVRERNLEDHIHFGGWVDYGKIHEALATCNVGLCPILRNVHHDTTYANKLFQYMAYGLVNVVSDCDAQANLIETNHCGVVHEAGNAKDLAAKLQWLATHPDEMTKMGQRGRSVLLKKFTPEKVYSDLVEFYREAETA